MPAWATEEPIEDFTNPATGPNLGQSESAGLFQEVEREILRAEAAVLITNLAPKQPKEVIADLTTKVIEGYKTDLETLKEWYELNKQIIDLAKLLVKKKTYAGD